MAFLRALCIIAVLTACGPSASFDDPDSGYVGPDGAPGTCTGSQTRCSGSIYQVCQNGQWTDQQNCAPQQCSETLGCVACNPAWGNTCVGDAVHQCNSDGTIGPLVQMCAFESCVGGVCRDPCGEAAQNRSYIGCEYWPVDLDNAIEVLGPELLPGFGCAIFTPSAVKEAHKVCWDGSSSYGLCDFGESCAAAPAGTSCQTQQVCVLNAQKSPFAIVVSNPDPSDAVMVTLTNAAGTTASMSVGPGAVQALFPQQMGFADQSLDWSGIETKAYKLTSNKPIVAYQFNPLDNVGVFSNDASLLLPAHTFDRTYYAVTLKTLTRRPQTNDYNGYVTVVASTAGTTAVMVTPNANVRAGTGTPMIPAGTTQTFTLNQFQTLTLEAVGDGDLTGTVISCDVPCGVFVGHEATVLSNQNPSPCCADHLEDQLFPASTWGKLYAVPRTHARAGAPDMLRIIAQKPGTTVSFNPAQTGCSGTMGPGQYCDVFITSDVEVSANEPILVAHFLLSTGGTDPQSGDPAISFAVPSEQYRTKYTLLVPMQYNANYMSIVAPAAGTVMLDGNDVTGQLTTFGSGMFRAGRIAVQAGQHKLDCPMGCGVEVYGWSDAVSYHFAGGLDLKQIVVE